MSFTKFKDYLNERVAMRQNSTSEYIESLKDYLETIITLEDSEIEIVPIEKYKGVEIYEIIVKIDDMLKTFKYKVDDKTIYFHIEPFWADVNIFENSELKEFLRMYHLYLIGFPAAENTLYDMLTDFQKNNPDQIQKEPNP